MENDSEEEVKELLPKFDYIAPTTIQEAVELCELNGNNAKILAGGTDLLVSIREGILKPRILIDIKKIREFNAISYDEGKALTIGSAVTLKALLESDVLYRHFSVLHEAVGTIADQEIRNRATLVGNICNASPAADTAPALLVLEAMVKIISAKGERIIKIQDFFRGVKKSAVENGEVVASVIIPTPEKGARGRYLKQKRVQSEDLALVGVAALVCRSPPKKRFLRIAYSSVAPTPIRIFEAEKIIEDDGTVDEQISKVVSMVRSKLCPISDVRAGKEYRAHLISVLTEQVLEELMEV